ncbi:hypothetical protein [Hanstruepera ponticola]|uniref:hypothetical protein n=1 Tax=Hanstruepera ponticola TaxID=2042995 RepID=UPI000CF1A088|nr:hypothetical protein [Hanstruepera ponticola]
MKSNYLLSNKFKPLGWFLFIIGLIGGIILYAIDYDGEIMVTKVFSIYSDPFIGDAGFFKVIENGIADELVYVCLIIGGLLVGFTKEKVEDEYIYKLRTESLVWAIIFNYILLLFTIVFVYDMTFFNVLIFNVFTPLLFFVFRFNFIKLKSGNHEE